MSTDRQFGFDENMWEAVRVASLGGGERVEEVVGPSLEGWGPVVGTRWPVMMMGILVGVWTSVHLFCIERFNHVWNIHLAFGCCCGAWRVGCGVWGVAPSYRVRGAVDESQRLPQRPILNSDYIMPSLILSSYSTASIFHFCFFSFSPISVSHVPLIDHMDTDVYSRLTTRHDWWEKTLKFSLII